MQPKEYYLARKGLYSDIVNHPDFDLGRREIEVLDRFLPLVARHVPGQVNILHLGIGDGREIPYFINHLSNIGTYLINDISKPDLEEVLAKMKGEFPHMRFQGICADIESSGAVGFMRNTLAGQTIVVLVGNSVIFANREVDVQVQGAMREDDLFVVTVESPHASMFRSYNIDPVYNLLSASGNDITRENTKILYDSTDHCLKIIHRDGQVLLTAYKPKIMEFAHRMQGSGFSPIELVEFPDIHMVSGVFRLSV